jgi:hypothetical protein
MLEGAAASLSVPSAEPVRREPGPPVGLLVGVIQVLADELLRERGRTVEGTFTLGGSRGPPHEVGVPLGQGADVRTK